MHVNLGDIDDTEGVKGDKSYNTRLYEIDKFELDISVILMQSNVFQIYIHFDDAVCLWRSFM